MRHPSRRRDCPGTYCASSDISPDYSCSCRPEQATGSTAGTSVASGAWRLHQAGSSFERRLRRSGIALRDLVPAYMNNPGRCSRNSWLVAATCVGAIHRPNFIPWRVRSCSASHLSPCGNRSLGTQSPLHPGGRSDVWCAFGKRAKCFLGEIGQRGGLPGSVGATSTGIRVGFAAGVTLSRQA